MRLSALRSLGGTYTVLRELVRQGRLRGVRFCCGKAQQSSSQTGPDYSDPDLDTGPVPDNGAVPRQEGRGKRRLHTPVMTREVLEIMQPKDGQVILDMTFGAGGHTEALLEGAPGLSRVLCLDRDPDAYSRAHKMAAHRPQMLPLHGRFSEVHSVLAPHGYGAGSLDAVLLDVGASSAQYDDRDRGFSISSDGPLDMRMDTSSDDQVTAADVVNSLDEEGLAKIIKRYGEEKMARHIARAIVDSRHAFGRITTTGQLATVVASAFEEGTLRQDKLFRQSHVATKTFQALRIFVNNELNELHNGLVLAQRLLRPGGVCVAICFHSLEDRIVKRQFHGIDMDAKFNLGVAGQYRASQRVHSREAVASLLEASDWLPVTRKVRVAGDDEVAANPRARSAKLRAAYKIGPS